MSSESDVRKLLKVRNDLEQRIEQLWGEIEDLKLAIIEIDKAIVKQGFHQPYNAVQGTKPTESKIEEHKQLNEQKPEIATDGSSIQAKDGTILGRIQVDDVKIIFTPREDLIFTTSTPPFQSFLLDRVLANMKVTDETRAKSGEIALDQVLSYEVKAEGDVLKSLTIHNYGGERRLREIQSSLRWSFDKMFDKTRR